MLSPLDSYASLEDFLLLLFTRSKIKKYFSKKDLKKRLDSKCPIDIPINLRNDFHVNPNYNGPPVNIIYQDKTFIVLDKPVGIATHPLNYSDTYNLLSFLRSKNIFTPLLVNTTTHEKGLLYRLDTSTSGVSVFVKDKNVFKTLRENYKSLVEKYYIAITSGIPKPGIYSTRLKNFGTKVKYDKNGKECNLEIKVLKSHNNLSLVKIKLITGFRHQIRFQLSNLGHPILGDTLYQGEKSPRVYLHAYSYKIKLEKEFVFNSDSVDDFKNMLSKKV